MTERPPTPQLTSPTTPSIHAAASDDRVVVTTTQLAAAVADVLGHRPDETALEDVLLELDRRGYVEWTAITRTGDYAWDLTDAPDRIADDAAQIVVERVRAWLGVESEETG